MGERLLILGAIVACAAILGMLLNALIRKRHHIDRIDPAELAGGERVVLFTSPYCHGCKQWLEALDEAAIGVKTIDIAARPDAAARYKISSTPRVVALAADGDVLGEFHHYEPRESDLDRLRALTKS